MPTLAQAPMKVPAVASCHRRHLDEHMDRGDTLRTHITTGAAAGALPQTPSRLTASLGTVPARSVAAYWALLAAAPGRLTLTLARGGTPSRPSPPLPLRVPRWGPPPPSAAALTETPTRVPCRVVSLRGLAAPSRRPGLGTRETIGTRGCCTAVVGEKKTRAGKEHEELGHQAPRTPRRRAVARARRQPPSARAGAASPVS